MVKSLYAVCINSKVIRPIYLVVRSWVRMYFAAKHWVIGPGFRGLHALIPLSAFEPDEAVLARAESILLRAIALGKEGRFKIVPEHISVARQKIAT